MKIESSNLSQQMKYILTIRMPNRSFECHYWRSIGEICGKYELRIEETTFIQRVRRTDDHEIPTEYVLVFSKTHRHAIRGISCQFYVIGKFGQE